MFYGNERGGALTLYRSVGLDEAKKTRDASGKMREDNLSTKKKKGRGGRMADLVLIQS